MMSGPNKVLSLENITFTRLSILIWSRNEVINKITLSTNGILYVEEALQLIRAAIFKYPLCETLKRQLYNVAERVGFEMYSFMNKLLTVERNLNFYTHLKWRVDGLIDERNTLLSFAQHNSNASLLFRTASLCCCEEKIVILWTALTDNEKSEMKTLTQQNLLCAYWSHFLQDNLDEFADTYQNWILGFDERYSLNCNLFINCVIKNNRSAYEHFYDKLTLSELQELTAQPLRTKPRLNEFLFNFILENQKFEFAKFVLSYFEVPIMEDDKCYSLVRSFNCTFYKDLMDYVVRQVNAFGQLHCKIFKQLFLTAPGNVKLLVIDELDFYLLTLLAKGHFDTICSILDGKLKKLVFEKIATRLTQLRGLSLFSAVYMNDHSKLLTKFFDFISEDEDDREIFRSKLYSIYTGTIYEKNSGNN